MRKRQPAYRVTVRPQHPYLKSQRTVLILAIDVRGVYWAKMRAGRWDAHKCNACGRLIPQAGQLWVSRRGETVCNDCMVVNHN